jgi:hypothetical protein
MTRLGCWQYCVSLVAVSGLGLVAGACLPDDPEVKGRLLYPGINIERPEFPINGQPWVMFEVRRSRAEYPLAGKMDVHLVNWLDGTHRLLLEGRSERTDWPRLKVGSSTFYYMVDERREGKPVGTLVRLSLSEGVLETLPDVISYSMHVDEHKFMYQKLVPDTGGQELHVREVEGGRDRNFGAIAGSVSFVGHDKLYFVGGEEKTLFRVPSFDAEPEPLRRKVQRFLLHPNEKLAMVAVSDGAKIRTVLLDLETRLETPLPVENPCCWFGFAGDQFVFADAASADRPTELHYYTLSTGKDVKVPLPEGIPNIASMVGRPPDGREILMFDQTRRITIYRPQGEPMFEVTGLRPSAPAFKPDGSYLVFLEPEPPPPPPAVSTVLTGKLYVQDARDWSSPPRLISPKGASVPVAPVGYRQRGGDGFWLLFWARYGLGGSDLYLSNPDTGEVLKVADGIGAVAVGERHVLGVIRISQDLTGDLVIRDFVSGQEQVIETGVADMQIGNLPGMGDVVAFVVRERMPSSRRNGLWAAPLQPLPPAPETAEQARSRREPPPARSVDSWSMFVDGRQGEPAGESTERPQ